MSYKVEIAKTAGLALRMKPSRFGVRNSYSLVTLGNGLAADRLFVGIRKFRLVQGNNGSSHPEQSLRIPLWLCDEPILRARN